MDDFFSDDDMTPPDQETLEEIKTLKTPVQGAAPQIQQDSGDGDFFSDEDMEDPVTQPGDSITDMLAAGAMGFGDSATLGFMDEMGGELAGAFAGLTGGDSKTTREDVTNRIRQELARRRSENPISSLTGNVVGGVAGMGKLGAAAKSIGAVGRFAKSSPYLANILGSTLTGGAYGVGDATEGERLAGGAKGAAFGAGGGVVFGKLGTKKIPKAGGKEIPIPPRFLERPNKVMNAPDLEAQATRIGKRHQGLGQESGKFSEKASQVLDKKNVQFPRAKEPLDILDRHEAMILRRVTDGDESRLSPKMQATLQRIRELKQQIGPRQLPDIEMPDPSGAGLVNRTKTVKGELKYKDMTGREVVDLRKQLDDGLWKEGHTPPDRAVMKNMRHDFKTLLENKGGAEYTRHMRKAERRKNLEKRLGKPPKHENDYRKFEPHVKRAGKGNRAAQDTFQKYSQVTPDSNFKTDALDRQTKEELRRIVNAIPESKGVIGKASEAMDWVLSPKTRMIKAGAKKIAGDDKIPKLPKYPTEQSFGPDQMKEVMRLLSPRQRYIVERQLKSNPKRGRETLEKLYRASAAYGRAKGIEHVGRAAFGGDE